MAVEAEAKIILRNFLNDREHRSRPNLSENQVLGVTDKEQLPTK